MGEKLTPFYVGARCAKRAAQKALYSAGLFSAVVAAPAAAGMTTSITPAPGSGHSAFAIKLTPEAQRSGGIVIISRIERDTEAFFQTVQENPVAAKLNATGQKYAAFLQAHQGLGLAYAHPKEYGAGYDAELNNAANIRDTLESIGIKTIPYENMQKLFNLNELYKAVGTLTGQAQQSDIPRVNLGPAKVAYLESITNDQPQAAAESLSGYLRIILAEHVGITDKKTFGLLDADAIIASIHHKTIPGKPDSSIQRELSHIDLLTTAPSVYDTPRHALKSYTELKDTLKALPYPKLVEPVLKALETREKNGLRPPATYRMSANPKPQPGGATFGAG